MRTFVIIALTALSFIGCSHSPTGPSTSTGSSTSGSTTSAVILPVYPGDPGTPLWHATSTVVSVSATLNSCPVDHAVGQQTLNVVWAIGPGPSSPSSILFFESPNVSACDDPRAPCYTGTRTGDQFAAEAAQDGAPGCFVWQGDLTGSFSADGRTFDAVENIRYVVRGEDDMVVSRHWTGTRP
jgi:hypothetical protein